MEAVVIIGSTPTEKAQEIEVYLTQERADNHILMGLLQAYQSHLGAVEPGGTLSLIINRAAEPVDGSLPPVTSGSFVINNPEDDRHVWDFHTRACDLVPKDG